MVNPREPFGSLEYQHSYVSRGICGWDDFTGADASCLLLWSVGLGGVRGPFPCVLVLLVLPRVSISWVGDSVCFPLAHLGLCR